MGRFMNKIKRVVSLAMSFALVITNVQLPSYAAEPATYSNTLDGWKVDCAWADYTQDYIWDAQIDSSREPKIVYTYRVENSAKAYEPGDLTITIPGIGSSKRGSIMKASKIAADKAGSDWNYSWDPLTDVYTFTNKFSIAQGESMSGGFEMLWKLNARDTINGFKRVESPTFTVAGSGSIQMKPLTFSFTSVRDRYRLEMKGRNLGANEFDRFNKNYIWKAIETAFDCDVLARGLYKSDYRLRIDLAEEDSDKYGDILISVGSSKVQLEQDEDGGWYFYPFRDRSGDLPGSLTTYIGFNKETLIGKTVSVSGHISRLYQDEEEYVEVAGENEKVDDAVSFTVETYGFTRPVPPEGTPTPPIIDSDVEPEDKEFDVIYEFGGYRYSMGARTATSNGTSLYSRMNARNIYNGKVVEFEINGKTVRTYDKYLVLKEDTVTQASVVADTTADESVPEGEAVNTQALDWNDTEWNENGKVAETNIEGTDYAEVYSDESSDSVGPSLFSLFSAESEAQGLNGNTTGVPAMEEDETYSMILGNDKVTVFLKDGSIRNLEDKEYDIAYVYIPKHDTNVEVYGATSQDTAFADYILLQSIDAGAAQAVQMPSGIKAAFVRINDLNGGYETYIRFGIRMHLDWTAELAKEELERVDATNRMTDFGYMRIMHDDSTGSEINDAACDESAYTGTYGTVLAARDAATYNECIMRAYSNLYLRDSLLDLFTTTSITDLSGSSRSGFEALVKSVGTTGGDTEGMLKKFSLYSVVPAGMEPDLNSDKVKCIGSVTDYAGKETMTNLLDYVSFRIDTYNGQTMVVADFDFTSHPLDMASGTRVDLQYPIKLTYQNYLVYGNTYTASTYLQVQDAGITSVNGSGLMADVYDIDRDENTEEKMATSSGKVTINEDISEWRGYLGKSVKTAYSTGYTTNAVTKLMDTTDDAEKAKQSVYEYRLDFGLGSSNAKNIVFIDNLEQGASEDDGTGSGRIETKSNWQGVFDSVDTKQAESIGLIPTVYYNTNVCDFDYADLENAEKVDLSTWLTECPEDKSSVKAIAVHLDTNNLDRGVFSTKQTTYVTIKMQAPTNSAYVGKNAVNQFVVQYDNYDLVGNYERVETLPSSRTTVKLMDSVGRMNLIKVDSTTGQVLRDPTFQVYDCDGNAMFGPEGTKPNALGRITLNEVPFGTYSYEELTAPEGYQKIEGKKNFQIDGVTTEIKIVNDRIPGKVTLTKYDKDHEEYGPLADAAYALYTADDSRVFTDTDYKYSTSGTVSEFVTGEDGTFTITGLPWGSYYLAETEAPDGYEISDEKLTFTIDKTIHEVTVDGYDKEMTASAELKKTEKETGRTLAGAIYNVERFDGENWIIVESYLTTNAAGEVHVDGLKFGKYRFAEVQSPRGYLVNTDTSTTEFTLDKTTVGKTLKVSHTDERKTGGARLYKFSDDGMPLEGAVFTLYAADGSIVAKDLITDANGMTPDVDGLTWGSYYFMETSAPIGYVLSSEQVHFMVNAENAGTIQSVSADNIRITGSVKLTKYDEATKAEKLSGAIFNLYTNDGAIVKENLATDENGEIYVDGLKWGAYYFQEMKAPAGYSVAPSLVRFAVNAQNCTVTQEVTCYDPTGLAQIKITKEINRSYAEFGTPQFIFRITGTDINGVVHEYFETLTVAEKSASVILSGIPAGTYMVEEINVSRYQQSEVVAGANATVADGKATITLTDAGAEGDVTFKNVMEQMEKASHVTGAINIVNAKVRPTSLTVTYKGQPTIASETESEYIFTSDDLEALITYDDGTFRVAEFADLTLDPAIITGNNNSSGSGFTVKVSYTEQDITVSDDFAVVIDLQIPAVPHTITFDANGGYFGDDGSETTNQVTYLYTNTRKEPETITKIVKTSNLSDDGAWDEVTPYGIDDLGTQSVTIPGAESLNVEITYQGSAYRRSNGVNYNAYIGVFDNSVRPSAANIDSSISGELYGTDLSEWNTWFEKTSDNYTIPGDTVQIFLTMKDNQLFNDIATTYGYYAKVSAKFPERTVKRNEVQSGIYSEPNHIRRVFQGWYTDQACTDGNEYDLDTETPLTEDITLYAKWTISKATMMVTGTSGSQFRGRLSTLAGGYGNIKQFVRAEDKPDMSNIGIEDIISAPSASDVPVFAWYDNGTIYWWSRAEIIYTPANMANYFDGMNAITDISGVESWLTGNTTNMSAIFNGCKKLNDLTPIKNWDIKNVETLDSAFASCTSLTNCDALADWDASKVTSLDGMFWKANALQNLNGLANWNTPLLTNIHNFCSECTSLIDVSGAAGLETGNVTKMDWAFYNCGKVSDFSALSGWDTHSVDDMNHAFYKSGITSTPFSNWDVSNVTNMSYAFNSCKSLADVSGIKNWSPTKATNASYMFANCTALPSISAVWCAPVLTNAARMFENCMNLTDVNLDLTGSVINDTTYMFNNNTKLTNLTITGAKFTYTMADMFHGCSSLPNLDGISDVDVSEADKFSSLFYGCTSLNDITGLNQWRTGTVNDMQYMFYNCTSLADVNALSSWNTQSVTTTAYMFYNCTSLLNIPENTWKFDKLVNANNMFQKCTSLETISEAGNWGMGTVSNMDYIFDGCTALKDITMINSWDLKSLISMNGAFKNCDSITTLTFALNLPKLNKAEYAFNSMDALESITGKIAAPNITTANYMFAANSNLSTANLDFTGTKLTGKYLFSDCTKLETVSLTNLKLYKNIDAMFQNCSALTNIIGLATIDVDNVTNTSYVFQDCLSLTDISALSNWNVSAVTTFQSMFENTAVSDLTPLVNWRLNAATNIQSMFAGCSHITSLDGLADWVPVKVTNMSYVFKDCTDLSDISALSTWRLDAATTIAHMFENDANITNLDALADWAPAKVTNVSYAFSGCTNLTDISGVSGWVYTNNLNADYLFYGTPNLKTADLSQWTYNLTNMNYMFNYGTINADLIIDLRSVTWGVGSRVQALPFPEYSTVYCTTAFYDGFFSNTSHHKAPNVIFNVVD